MADTTLRDLRCTCGRLLARTSPGLRGVVQVKCKGCHAIVEAHGDRVEVVEQGGAGERRPAPRR